jgi:anti-anti-sigma regulatory factor
MCFRIDCEPENNQVVLKVQGQLVGWEAEQVLRAELVRAVAEKGQVVVDVGELTVVDLGCLAAIETGLGTWLSVKGGGAYLQTLLRR